MSKGTLLFHLVAFRRRGQDQTVRVWTVSQLQTGTSNDVVYGGMAWNAPCAKAARQRVSTECVHHRSTFASMRNTDSESDAESDADTRVSLSMKVPTLLFGTQLSQTPDSGREAALKLAR